MYGEDQSFLLSMVKCAVATSGWIPINYLALRKQSVRWKYRDAVADDFGAGPDEA